MTLASATVLLFFVMDPLGNVPLFLSALRRVAPARHRPIILRELLIALAVMLAFLAGGRFLLGLLHISPAALTTAGGIVLLLIAVRMIFPTPDRPIQEEVEGEPFVVPLAVPYTAGPSALATELLLVSREPGRWPTWLAAICLAWLAAAATLYLASNLRRLLGDRGLVAVERLMGLLLVTVVVEMMMDGVAQFASTMSLR